MTDGTSQAAQTGGSSSSQSGSQQSSASTGAQDAASTTTQSSQAGTTTQQQAAAATGSQQAAQTGAQQQQAPKRPDYVPENFWDATAGKVKDKEFSEHLNTQTTRIAADESRRLALPQTPEAYEAKLPADFKAPDGIEFKIDANDPLLAQAKGLMHAIDQGKLSGQDAFSKLLGLYAGARVGEAAMVKTAREAELAKLGPTVTPRMTAIETFFGGLLGNEADGKAIGSRMFTADDVTRMEKIVAKFASQGTAPFSQQHRDHSVGKVDQATYDRMSYSEKKEYAAKHSNGQQAA